VDAGWMSLRASVVSPKASLETHLGASRSIPAATRKREGSPLPAELPRRFHRQRLRVRVSSGGGKMAMAHTLPGR
jgi:hypothetical protein